VLFEIELAGEFRHPRDAIGLVPSLEVSRLRDVVARTEEGGVGLVLEYLVDFRGGPDVERTLLALAGLGDSLWASSVLKKPPSSWVSSRVTNVSVSATISA